MYIALLVLHGIWRWVVLAAGVGAIIATFRRDVTEPSRSARIPLARMFSVSLDIQVLLGAGLYLLFSPLTTVAYTPVVGGAIPFELKFFNEYHAVGMFAAFLLIHAGSPLIRRAATEAARRMRARLIYGLTFLLVLAATPWWRPLIRL